jgi:hypothetical protein
MLYMFFMFIVLERQVFELNDVYSLFKTSPQDCCQVLEVFKSKSTKSTISLAR